MSQYVGYTGQAGVVTADLGDALKREKPDWKSKFITPASIFTCVGTMLLVLLSIVPVWNAITLLQDSNYTFWAGRHLPRIIITTCVLIIFLYAITVALFFRRSHASVHTEQTVMMIANIFITLFGLFLMLVSLPITHQSDLTYNNLLYRCDYSEQTHRLFEYSQVLHNMRATPACAAKYTVEDCDGYEKAEPYTSFLKGMEHSFHCAGFCYQAPAAAALAGGPPPAAPQIPSGLSMSPTSMIQTKTQKASHKHTDLKADEEEHSLATSTSKQVYPPTLFTDMNFKASCEGMSARDVRNFAGDIGKQTFYQGVYLVFIAVTTGFLKLMGFCVRKSS